MSNLAAIPNDVDLIVCSSAALPHGFERERHQDAEIRKVQAILKRMSNLAAIPSDADFKVRSPFYSSLIRQQQDVEIRKVQAIPANE